MATSYAGRLRVRFDKPATRWLLSLVATIKQSASHRRFVRVSHLESGAWGHRFSTGTVVSPRLSSHAPEQLVAGTHDAFLHGYVPGPGDVVVDVGAGSGTELVALSRLVGPTGRVIAIEAHPATFQRLSLTNDLNGCTNTRLVLAAIGADTGTVMIEDTDDPDANQVGTGGVFAVSLSNLDTLVEDLGLDRIDLLKMNIEGAEVAALRGAERAIQRVRHVAISCHDFLADGPEREHLRTSGFVRGWLEERGYKLHPMRSDSKFPWLRYYVYGSHT